MASVYLLKDDQILLLYRQGTSIVKNLWIGSAGGHFEPNELNDARACVLRELQEELQLVQDQIYDLSLRYVTLRYTENEIRQNYYFFAKLCTDVPNHLPSTEGYTEWFSLAALGKLPMPFTARCIIDHYLKIGQYDQELYGGVANEDCVIFHSL